MIKSLRSQTQHHQDISMTQRLVNQLQQISFTNSKQRHSLLTQQRKHRSMQFHKKKLQDISGDIFPRPFKPPSTELSLFVPSTPLSTNQIFTPSIRNIERSKNRINRFKDFKTGMAHLEIFEQKKSIDNDKFFMDLKFKDYCEIIDRDDPKCRQKRLLKHQLKLNKRPMNFQATNSSFADTFSNFTKEIQLSKVSTMMETQKKYGTKQSARKNSLFPSSRLNNYIFNNKDQDY